MNQDPSRFRSAFQTAHWATWLLALTTLARAASLGTGITYPGHLADAGQRFV